MTDAHLTKVEPLNVPGPGMHMTSEEGVRLELLLSQEIRAREKLSEQVQQLQQELNKLRVASAKSGEPCEPVKEGETIFHNSELASSCDQSGQAKVSATRLDIGDMYQPGESIWDAALFVGHDSLGTLVSVVLAALWAGNIVFQIYFCFLVQVGMNDNPSMTTSVLTELLRYRVGIGHNVEYADKVKQQSMISQVCTEDSRLAFSASQTNLYSDISNYRTDNIGAQLAILAQLLWLCTVFKEIDAAWNFGQAISQICRGSKSRILLTEEEADCAEQPRFADRRTSTGHIEPHITLMSPTRLKTITAVRFWVSMAFITLPRMFIAITLGCVGVVYLAKTSAPPDLILNAIALEFITCIDELIFVCFAPRRALTLVASVEAFPMPKKEAFCAKAGLWAIVKCLIIAVALIFIQFLVNDPFQWMLLQGHNILCSGELDFVYAVNPATGMAHVAKSDADTNWTQYEKDVLQVAKPTLEENNGWVVDADILELTTSSFTRVVIEQDPPVSSIDEATFDATFFAWVDDMWSHGVSDSAEKLQCKDLSAGKSTAASVARLQDLLSNYSIQTCADVPWQMCSGKDNTSIRAICPVRCDCDKPPRYYRGYSGYFQSEAGGCPTQCNSMIAARNEVLIQTSVVEITLGNELYSCSDVSEDAFYFDADCASTDQLSNALNRLDQSCSFNPLKCDSQFDDSDFTASMMCCGCGGGRTDVAKTSECMDELVEGCDNMDVSAFWFLLWVRGLFQVLTAQTIYRAHVDTVIEHELNMFALNQSSAEYEEFKAWAENGSLKYSLLNGEWELMPGVPHPRGLTGCAYLTSFEIKAILGVDLCSSETYSSIKFLCPESCGCTSTFYEAETVNGQITFSSSEDSMLEYSNQRTRMHECPASCLVTHPSVIGSNEYDNYDSSSIKGRKDS